MVSGCGPLTANELREEVSGLHSNAAEGALMAHEVALNKSRSTLTRVHAQELSADNAASEEKLSDAIVSNGLQHDVNEAIGLADEAATTLDQLALDPKDETTAADAERKLMDIAAKLDQLKAGL
ncbi:MAG: hypothetical protein QOG26_1216 [Solirubrobacterales bacterium]|nr:hypothetical protein [Solirubrobacterales bacterium]